EYDENELKLIESTIKPLGSTYLPYKISVENLSNGANQELVFAKNDTFIFGTLNTFNGIEPTYYIEDNGLNAVTIGAMVRASTFDHDNSGCSKLILNPFNANYSAIYSFPCAQQEKSQIKNNGSKSVQGKLSMKIQYWNGGNWIDEKIVVNEEIISIEAGSIFALDREWSTNGAYLAEKSGHFKVLVSFQAAGQEIEDSYEFLIE
ncbi:MAG: hypothetical protein Q8N60_02540, partial [Candidatus Diapherotrites archaeon]|nr:hypothetical protein [Candidatus Diapherotrites archaeon]